MQTITKRIKINWEDIKSIEKAEKQKARLENQGFILHATTGGITESTLVYKKTNY